MSSEQTGGAPGAVSDRVRALLARAAEEQLLEQRQVSTVLGELRALVEDVDERLATSEQVERVAAEVRALSARVEGRLDAAEARSFELAERITQANASVGQAAQDLAKAVAAEVVQRMEVQLRQLVEEVTGSVGERVESSERRLAVHVDDAVLALAEVVLRRRSAAAPVAPTTSETQQADTAPPVEAAVGPPERPDVEDPELDDAAVTEEPPPGDGFVLVPADVEEPDVGPAPAVQETRRAGERPSSERSDGSGARPC